MYCDTAAWEENGPVMWYGLLSLVPSPPPQLSSLAVETMQYFSALFILQPMIAMEGDWEWGYGLLRLAHELCTTGVK